MNKQIRIKIEYFQNDLFMFFSLAEGWYIYLETSSPVKMNDTARLQSPLITGSTRKCFEFWYHMHGPDINRLDIIIIDSSNVETTIWSRERSQGNLWRLGKVNLNDVTDSYSVRISFIRICRFC